MCEDGQIIFTCNNSYSILSARLAISCEDKYLVYYTVCPTALYHVPALPLLPDCIHELGIRQRLREHLIGPMVSEVVQVLWQRVPCDTHH